LAKLAEIQNLFADQHYRPAMLHAAFSCLRSCDTSYWSPKFFCGQTNLRVNAVWKNEEIPATAATIAPIFANYPEVVRPIASGVAPSS
jgi:hypothetical protein